MSDRTTIRLSRIIHDELRQLANERHQTVANAVSRAIRLLHQEGIGRDLSAPLTEEESSWLDAQAG